MIDRSISTSAQRLRTVLRTPTAQPQAIAETILEESGLQQEQARPEPPKDKTMTSPSHAALGLKSMLANIDERSSLVAERAARVEKRFHVAIDKYETLLGAKEAEVEVLEDAINQHTNGGEE